MSEPIAERFARDIGPHVYASGRAASRPHELKILHDEGLYRHLLCKSPDHSSYWFELITAPGSLTFRGDGDSFVFARQADMFAFFRGSSPTAGTRREYGINPYYWSEKLTDGGRGRAQVYDPDLFVQRVKEATVDAIRYGGAPRGIGKAVLRMLDDTYIADEHEARRALDDFEHGGGWEVSCSCGASRVVDSIEATVGWRTTHRLSVSGPTTHPFAFRDRYVSGFRFSDTFEWNFRDYDWWFLWACHAIVWAIARYDEARKAVAA